MSFGRARKPRAPLEEEALYEYAIGALGRQPRTVAQMKRLLRARVEPEEAGERKVSAVIARLKERGYLNDSAFAENYTRLRQENASLGRRRVQQDLMVKGVHANVIGRTLDAAYEAVNEEALARQHIERRRIRRPEDDRQTARVMRLLVRAGFSTATIYKILRQWDAPEAALSAVESLEAEMSSETPPHDEDGEPA